MNKNVKKMLMTEHRNNRQERRDGLYDRESMDSRERMKERYMPQDSRYRMDDSRHDGDYMNARRDRSRDMGNWTERADYSREPERHMEYVPDSRSRMNTEKSWAGEGGMMSYEAPRSHRKLDRTMAEQWTAGMKNEDGTTGPHWNMEQVKQAMAQRSIPGDPVEFYAVLNSLYSDFGEVFKKYNLKMDFYCDLARAWLDDSDAVDNKAAAYFEYVVRH